MEDPATQKLTVEKGDIDLAFDLTTDQVKALDASKGVKVYQTQSLTQLFAFFNTDPNVGGPVANPDVQRAIRAAIDYDGFVELIGGGAIKLPSIIQLGFLGALGPTAAPKTDLDKAKQLMAKAGFANGFEVVHETASTSKSGGVAHLTLAQKLQADLARIGVRLKLDVQDNTINLDRYREGKTPMGARGWGPDYPDALNQLAFCPGEKVGLRVHWKAEAAPELAQLCKQAMVELDETKRADMLKKIQLDIMDTSPWANLIQPGVQIAHRTNLEGVLYNPVYQLHLGKVDKK
jgi:peptide/nickel transport system substrate-binding protein